MYDHGPSRLAFVRMVLHYLLLLFRGFANTVGPFHSPQDFDHAEPSPPRAVHAEFSSGLRFVSFVFFFCSADRAIGFPDSSCLFFDLIPFAYLLS